jgi:uncharacterized protein (UPF0254 family)
MEMQEQEWGLRLKDKKMYSWEEDQEDQEVMNHKLKEDLVINVKQIY